MNAPPQDTPTIHGYHAHVYFNAETQPQARALCEAATARFSVQMGHMHSQPVGPHPDGSCQLAFKAALFGEVVPWLALHRAGLVVFVHPLTGQDLADHRDRAIWMGAVRPLDLSVLPESSEPGHPVNSASHTLHLRPVNAGVFGVHGPDGQHLGNLKRVGAVWKFKAVGHDAAGQVEPGGGPLTGGHNTQFAEPDAAAVNAALALLLT